MPRQVLGRGLEALIPTKTKTETNNSGETGSGENPVVSIPVSKIVANPHQPRRHFAEDELRDLAESIRKHGVLQPLLVTKVDGGFELIAGERRSRAAKLAGLAEVPAIVKEATDQDKLEIAIVENLHRSDLNPMEKARAYRRLIDDFKLTQEGVAIRVGKSREQVANTLRLLDLPEEIQEALAAGKITTGHAKAILGARSETERRRMFNEILRGKVNVRGAERLVPKHQRSRVASARDPFYADFEEQLREKLGAKVTVLKKAKGARLVIDCYSPDEFRTVAGKIVGEQM